jgi:hypothetical protein
MPDYDIFISYKSEQWSWARRLAASLKWLGYKVFLDHDRDDGIPAGAEWQARLDAAVRDADYFILLWSQRVGVDSYVLHEVDERRNANRGISVVRLDNAPGLALLDKGVQDFTALVDLYRPLAGDEVPDADDVDPFDWQNAILGLAREVLECNTVPVQIPFVVCAMNADEVRQLVSDPGEAVVDNDAFTAMMSVLDDGQSLDPERYGITPEEWRPFSSPGTATPGPTVEELLLEAYVGRRKWQHDFPGDDRLPEVDVHMYVRVGPLLRDQRTRARAQTMLANKPSVVIFDAVSLLHRNVHQFVMANALHMLPKAFVVGVGPTVLSPSPVVQDFLAGRQAEFFEKLQMDASFERATTYFNPTLSACVLNVERSYEFSRWVQLASESMLTWIAQSTRRMNSGYSTLTQSGPARPPGMVRG